MKTTLEKLGLNSTEVTIYLSLLPVGSAPASVLSYRTGICCSTARMACKQLVSKGLLSMEEKGNMLVFTPEPPEKITYLVENKKRNLDEMTEQLNRIVGPLKAMIDPTSALPRVRFFEGTNGLICLYEEILELNSPIQSFEDKGDMAELIPDYIPKYIKKRIEKKIPCRSICPTGNRFNQDCPSSLLEVKKINKEEFQFTCDIKICGDQVSIFSFDKEVPAGIAIRHKDIADNFRIMFEYMWNTAKQEDN